VTERWYHGGVPGLKRGDKILPPSVTGAFSIADLGTLDPSDDMPERVAKVHSRDRVYLAASLKDARLWASLHPAHGGRNRGGDLYEVTLDGPAEPDPDYLAGDGGSICCTSATIVRVVERRVPRPSGEALAALAMGGAR
jgi:hypothetical protein